jgi:hypothetical protein
MKFFDLLRSVGRHFLFFWVNDRLEAWTPAGLKQDAAAVSPASFFENV